MTSLFFLKTTQLFYARLQKRSLETDPKAISHSVLADGTDHIVSYDGTGQYNGDETRASACGLAALNFARVTFSLERSGLQDVALLQAVLARECAEESTAICSLWSGNLNLEVEYICRIPLFERTLKLKTTKYGLPGALEFKSLLTEMNNLESSAVTIITRPPEILACLKLRLKTRNVFIIFDSHPRPSYPSGAGMMVSPSIESTARRLAELLPAVDVPDGLLPWQARLLANYSGHVFVPHGVEMSTPTLWQAVLESSLAQLSMQAELTDLRSQTDLLKIEQQRLEGEIKVAEAGCRLQERLLHQLQSSMGNSKYYPSATPPRHFSSSLTHHSYNLFSSKASTSASTSSAGSRTGHPRDDGLMYAVRSQHEIAEEDRAFPAQRTELSKSAQRLSECSICMEEMPVDSIARIDSCGHTFCRECLRGHVAARIDERRYPVLCPTCVAHEGKEKVGEVSQSLALNLGLTDKQFSIWTEMELAPFSVILHCRKCERSMFVARDEVERVTAVVCPFPKCNYAWCKLCQQSIDILGPKHSCDGTSELDHLMKLQGWKYCPTCKTPVQKESGCNKMTCITPGCNTRFCYVCGAPIVRSCLGQEIKQAVRNHFAKNCKLFHVPE